MPASAFAFAGQPRPKLKFSNSVDIDGFCLWVQVLKRARLNPGAGNERVHFLFLQPDHSTELVRGQLPFINEFVQGAKRHPETASRIVGRQPAEV
jgi:hypothetical protein